MSDYGTILYTGLDGPTNLYTGSGNDQLQSLDFYRTETDGDYVFHWTFLQSFISPAIANLDYILQLDLSPTFNLPTSFEITTEVADTIIANGYSRSGAYADINAPFVGNWTLILNIDGDGAQTITLAGNTSGAAIAANVQTLVRALTANTPSLQASYNNFTATYDPVIGAYTLTSGGTGITSSVVVLGGTGAPHMMLGLINGGYQVVGNTFILSELPGGILTVVDASGTIYTDVSATTNNPGPNQFVASLPFGQITFNSANLPDVVTVVYFPSFSGPIFGYQNGNVEKGFTVPVPPRIASAPVTFYARVAIKYSNSSFGPWSNTLTVLTIPNVINETFSRLMLALPDFHVYPTDNAYLLAGSLVDGIIPNPLPNGLSNIAKVYLAYANEFDTEYLEKENAIRDVRQDRVRDDRIGSILGALYKYPQPSNMQNVDYRLILSNMKAASLDGATYEAVKLVGAAFTGVDPTIFPISKILNFITAGFNTGLTGGNYSGVVENVRVNGFFEAALSSGVASDPIIPGSLISGPVVSISESDMVSATSPFILTLVHIPASIPVIAGYTFTTGTPSATQFNVDYATGILTFNAAAAGLTLSISYVPNYESDLPGETLIINVDGLGPRMITLGVGPYTTKAQVAAEIQKEVQALGNPPATTQLALLASTAITNTGSSVITGDVDLTPGSSVTGFPPGTFSGTLNIDNAVAINAMAAANAAFTAGQTMGLAGTTIPSNLNGQVLSAGAYKFASGFASLASAGPGTLTFSGPGNFIIYTASTLTTGAGGTPTMLFSGGASPANVLWVVGSSATINVSGTGVFEGRLIAQVSITMDGGSANGQLSALTGAITISAASNIVGSNQTVSPSENTVYTDFIAFYDSATDTYTLVSGNRAPTPSSSVVVTGGTAADQLRLLAADSAIATTGLVYETPPTVPSAGQFVNDIVLGDGGLLTFPAVEVGNFHTVLFLPATEVFTYLPGKTVQTFTVPAVAPYTITLPTSIGAPFFDGGSCDIPVVGTPIVGTVEVATGSTTVTGTGTTFMSLSVGDNVVFGSQMGTDVDYYIETIASNTDIVLTASYEGPSAVSTTMTSLSDSFVFVPSPTVVIPPAIVPPTLILAPGQFTDDFGSPAHLRFASSFASETVVVSYTVQVPIQDIDSVKDHPILFSGTEAGFGIEIILNNPGMFTLDLKNIAFLITQILPATTKFILTEVE